jgi:hypothetical protein
MLETVIFFVVVELVDEDDIGADLLNDGSDGIRLCRTRVSKLSLQVSLLRGIERSVERGKRTDLHFDFSSHWGQVSVGFSAPDGRC